jgi:propanediol utilization protein
MAITEYRKFVGDPHAQVLRLPSGPVLGDDTFVEAFRTRAGRAGREVPGRERRLVETLDVFFAGAITRRERNRQIVEAHRHGHMVTTIARYLGVHYSTVSKVIKTHEADLRP